MGRSSSGQSAFVAAFGCDIDSDADLGAAFSDGFNAVKGGLDDSPIPWGWIRRTTVKYKNASSNLYDQSHDGVLRYSLNSLGLYFPWEGDASDHISE